MTTLNEFAEFGLRVVRAVTEVIDRNRTELAGAGLFASEPTVEHRANLHSEVEVRILRDGDIEDVIEHFIFDSSGHELPLAEVAAAFEQDLTHIIEDARNCRGER